MGRVGVDLVAGGVALVRVGAFIVAREGRSNGAVGSCGAFGGVVVVLDFFVVVYGIEVGGDFGLFGGGIGAGLNFFRWARVLVVILGKKATSKAQGHHTTKGAPEQ